MINEYERVRIKRTGVEGIIVDVRESAGITRYLVESDNEKENDLFDCEENELEVIL